MQYSTVSVTNSKLKQVSCSEKTGCGYVYVGFRGSVGMGSCGDTHRIFFCGCGMGMGIEILSPRQPCLLNHDCKLISKRPHTSEHCLECMNTNSAVTITPGQRPMYREVKLDKTCQSPNILLFLSISIKTQDLRKFVQANSHLLRYVITRFL